MHVGSPILDFVPGPRGLVLAALLNLTGRMTGRDIARYSGVPQSTTARVLADLVDAGVVTAEPIGSGIAYQLNRDHLFHDHLAAIAGARVELAKKISKALGEWEVRPVAGWEFGSTARQDGNRLSDIDVVLVAPDRTNTEADPWAGQVFQLSTDIERWTGNPAQVLSYTRPAFRQLTTKQNFTRQLQSEGLDLVAGGWANLVKSA